MHTNVMNCVACGGKTKVTDSRTMSLAEVNGSQYAHLSMANAVWPGISFRSRRRRCVICEKAFDTIEVPTDEIKA